jgi:hypothetical protein
MLILKTGSSMPAERLVKVPGEILAKLEALRPELIKLSASLKPRPNPANSRLARAVPANRFRLPGQS